MSPRLPRRRPEGFWRRVASEYLVDFVLVLDYELKGDTIFFDFVWYDAEERASTARQTTSGPIDLTLDRLIDDAVNRILGSAGERIARLQSTAEPVAADEAESTQIDLSGTWSVAAGTYWLIVDVSSADEDIPDNNTFAAGPFAVNDPPNVDYTNILVSHISGSAAGRSFADYFTVENTGTDDGAAPVCALTFCIEDTG